MEQSRSEAPTKGPGQGLIFVCDASAEAGRLMGVLRGRGYTTVDVPLGLLPNRARYEPPDLVLADADAHEALERVRELRADPGLARVPVLFLGAKEGALEHEASYRTEGQGTFLRPLAAEEITARVEELIGAPAARVSRRHRPAARRAPTIVASSRRPYRSDESPSTRPPQRLTSLPAPELPPPEIGPTPSKPSIVPLGDSVPESALDDRPSTAALVAPELSRETRALLERARDHASGEASQAPRPTRLRPRDHDSVLPPELVSALDAPLEDIGADEDIEDEPPLSQPVAGGSPPSASPAALRPNGEESIVSDAPFAGDHERVTPRPSSPTAFRPFTESLPPPSDPHAAGYAEGGGGPPSYPSDAAVTNPGGRPGSFPAPPLDEAEEAEAAEADQDSFVAHEGEAHPTSPPTAAAHGEHEPVAPARDASETSTAPPLRPSHKPAIEPIQAPPPLPPTSTLEPQPGAKPPPRPAPPPAPRVDIAEAIPAELSEGGGAESMALAIRERASGALALQSAIGIRRVVFRDGDIVTAVSGVESESLTRFLASRGDMDADIARHLARTLPPFGRHAAAALIANGHLRQGDLWPLLRAHAEWVLACVVSMDEGQATWERNIPTRLLDEPAVFGGAAGCEVFVDIIRRCFEPEEAWERLGGGSRVIALGAHHHLLGESALEPDEEEQIRELTGRSLGRVRDESPELLPLLYALNELDAITTGGRLRQSPRPPDPTTPPAAADVPLDDPYDDEAFAARIRTRRALVDDGDYFALLGLQHRATGYEVERAHAELKRQLDPAKLTARNARLAPDLELVLEILDEAREILRDDVRRERYRRAIAALPTG